VYIYPKFFWQKTAEGLPIEKDEVSRFIQREKNPVPKRFDGLEYRQFFIALRHLDSPVLCSNIENETKSFIELIQLPYDMNNTFEMEPQMSDEPSQIELQNYDQVLTSVPKFNVVALVEGVNNMSIVTQASLKLLKTLETVYHAHYGRKNSFSITVDKIKPIRPWKPAKPETVEEFSGILVKLIPALATISDDRLDHIIDNIRNKEED
jgi:hypothetical protein